MATYHPQPVLLREYGHASPASPLLAGSRHYLPVRTFEASSSLPEGKLRPVPACGAVAPNVYNRSASGSSASFSPAVESAGCCRPSIDQEDPARRCWWPDTEAQFPTPLTSPDLTRGAGSSREKTHAPVAGPPPPMSKIAEFMAQMLCYVWLAEPSTPSPSTRDAGEPLTPDPSPLIGEGQPVTPAQLVPNPAFVKFVQHVLATTQVSSSVVLLALLFVHRLKSSRPMSCQPNSEYRIAIVSLMLANKMLDDHTYTARTWADVSGLSIESINEGEVDFLTSLKFELHVDIRAFSAWFRLLQGMVEVKERASASRRRRSHANPARSTRAWRDSHSVLEGIVTPLRNAPLMRSEEERMAAEQFQRDLQRRRVSEGGATLRSRSATRETSLTYRPVLPLPHPAPRGRSPSPAGSASMGHRMSRSAEFLDVAAAAPPSCCGSRMSWSPEGPHASTPHFVPAYHKRSASEEFVDGPPPPKKAAAMNRGDGGPPSGLPVPAPSQPVPRYQPRLPPILVSDGAPSVGQPHPLGVPILPPIPSGRASRGELYFYSLAANGGHQLMRQQHPVAPTTVGQPYVFGSGPWLGTKAAPTAPSEAAAAAVRRSSECWYACSCAYPPRGALSQHSSPIAAYHHSYQPHAVPTPVQYAAATVGRVAYLSSPPLATPTAGLAYPSTGSAAPGSRTGARRQASPPRLLPPPPPSSSHYEPSGLRNEVAPRYSTFSNAGVPGVYWSHEHEALPAAPSYHSAPAHPAQGSHQPWSWSAAR